MKIWLHPPKRSPLPGELAPPANGRTGFTLLEMLVVIGIIAMLAALLVPAVSKAMGRARSVACVSNLRQIAMGLQDFATENKETYPLGVTSDNKTWVDRTIPYLGQTTQGRTVWLCPDAPLPIDSNNQSLYGTSYAFSYAINDGLAYIPSGQPQLRIPAITYPSEVILIADATQSAANKNLPAATLYRPILLYSPLSQSRMNDLIPVADCEGYGSLSFHHPNETCNASMCDGSVRSFKRGDVRKKNFAAIVN